jgi:hypothetical protein
MFEEAGNISPGSLVITICLGILLVVLPRRFALVPIFIGGSYLTLGQSLILGGAHFHLIRILIAFGLLRILIRGEILSIQATIIDKLLVAWLMTRTFLYVLGSSDTEHLFERLGYLYNTVGIYFLVRAVVQGFDDIVANVKVFGVVMIPLVIPFIVEYTTGRNPFSILGGVPEYGEWRGDRLRCQGPFLHPILAGTFGATAMPLFVGLWKQGNHNRLLALGGIVVATLILMFSSSSGPLLAYLVILTGLIVWMFRTRLRMIRWGIVIALLILHTVMKVPVWFLISRLSNIFGGGGHYRSALIDAFVNHFNEWWLIGTTYTAHWMPTGLASNPKMTDMVNQYVAQGVAGGLLCLILFIWLIVECFRATGSAILDEDMYSRSEQFMIWSLGCALLGHIASFFSVSYFDQINIVLYLVIGMIAALAQERVTGGYEVNQQEGMNVGWFPLYSRG